MIQSGASGLIPPVDAPVVLWRLLLVLPRMIQSRALHGLLTALLHLHGLVQVFTLLHHHRLLHFAASLLLHSHIVLPAAPHHHGLVNLFTLGHHHGRVLICASPQLQGLVRMAASLHHCSRIHRSVSLLHLGPVLIIAALHLLGLVLISVSLHLPRVALCVASGHESVAAPPWPRPLVSYASGRHFALDAPARRLGTPAA